jgi:hypothetical protein
MTAINVWEAELSNKRKTRNVAPFFGALRLHVLRFTLALFPLPSIALSFVIASLIGLAFYLLFGRGWLRLVVYWLVALVGFFIGQIITTLLSFSLFPIGSTNLIEATVTCLIALFVMRAMWKTEPEEPI